MRSALSRNPTLARLTLAVEVYGAGAAGTIADDPDHVLALLQPAVEKIEASAREQLEALRGQLAAARKEREAICADFEAQIKILTRLREEADADAAELKGSVQEGPLEPEWNIMGVAA